MALSQHRAAPRAAKRVNFVPVMKHSLKSDLLNSRSLSKKVRAGFLMSDNNYSRTLEAGVQLDVRAMEAGWSHIAVK